LTIVSKDPAPDVYNEMEDHWNRIGHFLFRNQAHIDSRFDRLETDVGDLKSDVAGVKSDVAGLKSDVGDLKSDVGDLKADVGDLKSDVAGLKSDVADLTDQVGRLELATERRFNRLDARLERVLNYIEKDELGGATPA
jgi:archaellum component FlaC